MNNKISRFQNLFNKILISIIAILSITAESLADQALIEPPKKDWNITPIAALYNKPDFIGSKYTDLQFLPDVQITYKDKFFGSITDRTGYNVINENALRMGPVSKIRFARTEKYGDTAILLTRHENNGLRGMGDVAAVLELGGFMEYKLNDNSAAKVELRQGVNNSRGLVAEVNLDNSYKYKYIEFSFGPRANFANADYNNTYFGVNSEQSTRTGLRQYRTKGGLVSYGFGADVTIPLSLQSAVTIFTTHEFLAPNIANSSFIKSRGAERQSIFGVGFGYNFGFNN